MKEKKNNIIFMVLGLFLFREDINFLIVVKSLIVGNKELKSND